MSTQLPHCKSLKELVSLYTSVDTKHNLRFGQWFCCWYTASYDKRTNEMFDMNFTDSVEAVNKWLYDHGYTETLPTKILLTLA